MDEKRTYSAEEIIRYIEGKMSAAEMHAIEKAALDDPFLADAIQGAEMFRKNYPDADFSKDVEELRKKIVGKRERKRVMPLLGDWWKVAAVLFVVFSGVGLIFLINEKNNFTDKELARKEDRHVDIPENLPPTDSAATAIVSDKNTTVTTRETEPSPKLSSQKRMSPPVADAVTIPERHTDTVSPASPAAAKKEEDVVEAFGIHKPSAKSNPSGDRSVIKGLEGRAAGIQIADASPSPEGGWDAFYKYISANKSTSTIDSSITGSEVISFSINKKGRPHSFRILQSLSAAHDSLSVHLLQKGPSWTPANRKKREATINLTF